MTRPLYAEPRVVEDLKSCWFYHTMQIPGYGLVEGQWDLRGQEHHYTGGIDFTGRRVLEVGTASGQLCFYMERQGAEVVGFDLSDDFDWDVVPLASIDHDAEIAERRKHIRQLNNGWWLGHRAFESKAKVVYGTVYDIPVAIGPVDVAIYGSVLLHCRDPFQALYNGLRLTRSTVVVTDIFNPRRTAAADGAEAPAASPRANGSPRSGELATLAKKAAARLREGDVKQVTGYLRRYWRPADLRDIPVMEFVPEFQHGGPLDSWWYLTPEIVQQFIGVLGFGESEVHRHTQKSTWGDRELFTVVGHRTQGRPVGA
jgi:SAM-dependent methyltransferase